MSKLVDREVLKSFREKLDERYVIEGEYSPNTRVGNSDYADNLTPYSADSGVYQAIPYNFQPTGCGNGETQVDTGSYALFKEKRGNGIVYNQLIQNCDFSQGKSGWYTVRGTLSMTDNVATLTCTEVGNAAIYSYYHMIAAHKYLNIAFVKAASGKTIYISGNSRNFFTTATGQWQVTAFIDGSSATTTLSYPRLGLANAVINDTIQYKYFCLIDLTKWFKGNIPQYLLDHPESFFRYYSGDLSYNTGEVRFSNARYFKTYGRNQWDEEWEAGIYNSQGQPQSAGNSIRNKNKIRVNPNTVYYVYKPTAAGLGMGIHFWDDNNFLGGSGLTDNKFITPSNCTYINFYISGYGSSSYQNNVTILIYYDGESGYDQHYAYEELANVDTGTEQLYAAGLAYDRKEPSGLIIRNVGNRAYQSGDENDNTLLTDGTTTYYPLETPTTEQGTPFTESVKINDFGSMSLESANGVPQGNMIFYPVDYKAYVDTLVNYTDGDATSLAKKSDIVQELPDAPSTDGTYALKATVSSGTVSYEWVEEGA